MNKRFFIITVVLVLVLVFFNLDAEAQCAMCKKVAAGKDGKTGASVGRNINSAILYLMAIPYLAIGFIFRKQLGDFYRSLRKK
jgi:hypothetical protein